MNRHNAIIEIMSRISQKSLALCLILTLISAPGILLAQDTDAPVIQNVQVTNNSDTSITVTWQTDESADSLINYGLQEDYGIIRVPGTDKTQHSITIEDMEPGRTNAQFEDL